MGAKGQQGQSMYYELGLEKREQLANRKEKKKKAKDSRKKTGKTGTLKGERKLWCFRSEQDDTISTGF